MNCSLSGNRTPFFLILPQHCEDLVSMIGDNAQIYRLSSVGPSQNGPNIPVARSGGVSAQQLDELLRALGIPRSLQGHRYIKEAVRQVAADPSLTISLTKRLYPSIAAKFTTSTYGVERAIRYAVEIAWSRCDERVLNAYFDEAATGKRGKPTNGEFISRITNLLLEDSDWLPTV